MELPSMLNSAALVLSAVNAPYGASLTAHELAARICKLPTPGNVDAAAFSFYSEVRESLQRQFIQDMRIDPEAVEQVARAFSDLAGFTLPLGRVA